MTPKPNDDDAAKYGYEDPDAAKYGYEDPDAAYQQKVLTHHGQAGGFLRRGRGSSMKQEGSRRQASIHTVGTIEVRLPGHSNPIQRRTSIEFVEPWNVEIQPETEYYDHDGNDNGDGDDNVSNQWMAPEEYVKIEKDNHKIVRAIEKGTDKHFCTRGLEGKLTPSLERIRQESRQVVWEEQQRQKNSGCYYDDGTLSEKYRLAVLQAKIDAVERAEQDKADIEQYLKSTRKMMRRTSC